MHFIFVLNSRMASAFCILIFSTSTYWLFFYKGQSRLFLFLPHTTFDLLNLNVVFITAIVAQSSYVGYLIYKQCTVDMFFIDWEKSQHGIKRDESTDTLEQPDSKLFQASIWRTFFVANQWNNLVASSLSNTAPSRHIAA